jgi:dihydrodipicolinate synthase/N-acetylneuraminate lyase
MNGTGLPLATPFDDEGDVDHAALAELVTWVEERGVDFLVPCGSNSEAPLLTAGERTAVVETVADRASVPVLAGTGAEGRRETLELARRGAAAGADGALVVTPYYFDHGSDALETYYRAVADESPVPVYLYSVPAYTGTRLSPEVVGALADHANVAGMKDSSGDLSLFQRYRDRTPEEFDLFVGAGGVYAAALDAGADGGVLALANVVPELAARVFDVHDEDPARARATNRACVELNHAITAGFGVPGLKAAMRSRGAPAGRVRSPHRPVDEETEEELAGLVDQALETAPE